MAGALAGCRTPQTDRAASAWAGLLPLRIPRFDNLSNYCRPAASTATREVCHCRVAITRCIQGMSRDNFRGSWSKSRRRVRPLPAAIASVGASESGECLKRAVPPHARRCPSNSFRFRSCQPPGDRRSFLKRPGDARLEPIFAKGRRSGKIEARIGIDRDESTAWFQATGDATAHCRQLLPVARVIQQISRHNQAKLVHELQIPRIPHRIVDSQAVHPFLAARQLNHALRQVDAGDFGRASGRSIRV